MAKKRSFLPLYPLQNEADRSVRYFASAVCVEIFDGRYGEKRYELQSN